MRYNGEPVPRPAPDVADELSRPLVVGGSSVTGTGALDIPIPSLPFSRSMFGTLLEVPAQDLDIGMEIPQASAGRPIVSARLTFPDQSDTPEPDRRRIARPMPSAARDEGQVIR